MVPTVSNRGKSISASAVGRVLRGKRHQKQLRAEGYNPDDVYGRTLLRQLRELIKTLRRAFLKIAVRIQELKSRIKVAFPSAYPHAPILALIAGVIATRGP